MKLSRWKLCVIAIALCLAGAAMFVSGWQGLLSGEITITPRRTASFVASAAGPNASQFIFEVWLQLLLGGTLAVVGIGILIVFFRATPEKMEAAIDEVNRAGYLRKNTISWYWLIALVLVLFFGLFIYKISGGF